MTTIYVHNNNQSQNITCSDGSQGVLHLPVTLLQARRSLWVSS